MKGNAINTVITKVTNTHPAYRGCNTKRFIIDYCAMVVPGKYGLPTNFL